MTNDGFELDPQQRAAILTIIADLSADEKHGDAEAIVRALIEGDGFGAVVMLLGMSAHERLMACLHIGLLCKDAHVELAREKLKHPGGDDA